MLINSQNFEPTWNSVDNSACVLPINSISPINGVGSQTTSSNIDHSDQTRIKAQLQAYCVVNNIVTGLAFMNLNPEMLESPLPLEVDLTYPIVQSEEKIQLETKLDIAFEANPLEDGIVHQAEQIIDNALRLSVNQDHLLDFLADMTVNIKHPDFAASVLRCLSRLQLGKSTWRTKILQSALTSEDVEIRDTAVEAAETWQDIELRGVLQRHNESAPWLRNYIGDVIADLGE